MKYLIAAMMVVSAASANVDIVRTDQGLCVGWTSSTGAKVKNLDESCQIQFSPLYDHISIGDGMDTGVSSLVVALSDLYEDVEDSLFLLESQSLTRLSSRAVYSDSILEEPAPPVAIHVMKVSRYDYGMRHLLACVMGEYTSTLSDTWVTNSTMVDDGGDVALIDHKQHFYGNQNLAFPRFSGPVSIMGNSFVVYRIYNWFTTEYYHSVVSLSYDMPIVLSTELPPLFSYQLYSATNYNSAWAGVIAAGSDLQTAVALWGDCGLENIYTSLFTDDVQPASTSPFPFPYPKDNPAAMSCHPYYNGMLLAWVQGSELRCRHFDGGWNDYDHIVQTGLGAVSDQDIAVCSDVDGYWIAWLESGADEPEVVYVPMDSVTGISGGEASSAGPVLELFPNPFGEILRIVPSGFTGGCRISIYDTAGRIVESSTISGDSWSWDASSVPTGVYSVVAESSRGIVSRRVLHLKFD